MHYRLLVVLVGVAACGSSPEGTQIRAVQILVHRVAPAQQAYRETHGVFAPDARSLFGDDAVDGLRVLIDSDTAGWNASVFDPGLMPATCVMSVGQPARRRKLAGGLAVRTPGTIVCLDHGEWACTGRIVEVRYDSLGHRF